MSWVVEDADVDQAQRTATIQLLKSTGINNWIICCRTGEDQRTGAQAVIKILEWAALHGQIREVGSESLCTAHSAVQNHNT